MTTFVLATANPHKAEEMQALLGELQIDVMARPRHVPDVEETEETLEGNSLLKARALVAATGMAAIADDTGLFVDALDGRPGVYSARYAGEHATYEENVQKLLGELQGTRAEQRTARFRSVIVVAFPNGEWFSVEGILEGSITENPVGANGFGYDPVFAPSHAGGKTLAEMSSAEKNEVSHRGNALRALALALAAR